MFLLTYRKVMTEEKEANEVGSVPTIAVSNDESISEALVRVTEIVEQVESLVASGEIPEEEGRKLLYTATKIIGDLTG